MSTGTRTVAVCAAVCLGGSVAGAQSVALTLADVLSRARQQAPAIVNARLTLDEARARLAAASLRVTSNPGISGAIGNRHGPEGRFTDFEVGVSQAWEPAARRDARVAGVNASIREKTADVDAVTQSVLHDAASAYYRALHATERIRLLDSACDLATTLVDAADRRFRAGDIAVLDVNVAHTSLGRIRAEREGAEALKALVLGELRRLLQLEGDIGVSGSLAIASETDLAGALTTAAQRPELRAFEAAIEEAEAEIDLGRGYTKPDYDIGVRYSREEGDQIVMGGLTIRLPLFAQGQEQRSAGAARAARLRAEMDAVRRRTQFDVRTAFDTFQRRLGALRVLEREALPGLDENEQLSARSFDVGQIGLPELLLIRREILDTRFAHLDALLEAALARLDLDASSGVLR